MASASGSNPAPRDETKTGTEKGDKAQGNCKASADLEIEKHRKLEEELRESKGEVQRKSERIKSLEAELEARNAEVKKLKRERESRIREATIKEKIVQGRQLDVAFLVHVDEHVSDNGVQKMKQHINFIQTIVDRMASENKKQEWKLRVAFAPYRDYKYHKSVKFDAEPCDFTHRFTSPSNLLKRALSRFGANNSDYRSQTQEYFGGTSKFEEYLAMFDWKATNRVIIHITDDRFRPQYSMKKQDVETAIGGSLKIVDMKFKDLQSMTTDVVLKLTKPLLPPITKYLPEQIDKQPLPNQIQCQSYFEHKWCEELEDLITTITENKDLLYMEGREKVQVQIAETPFKDDHPAMWPYLARVTVPGEAPKDAVAYRFKTPVENDHSLTSFIRDWHKGDNYLARMEVHSVATRMAAAFNENIERHKIGPKLEFPKVTTLSIGSRENTKFYNVVEDPKGSSKGSPKTTDHYDDILQAFTHWTHHISDTLLMIQVNPQGVEIRENVHRQDEYLCLSDPVIHCSDVMRFLTHNHIDTHTNLGSEGFKLFSASHDCNEVCKELGLTRLS